VSMDFPKTPEDISSQWLGDRLREVAVLAKGSVASVAIEPFAEGLGILGKLVRLTPTYSEDAEGEMPSSLVAKFPAEAEANLQLAHGMRFYQREYEFYERAASRTPFRVPRMHYSAIDDANNFLLLMEDVPATMCDQVAGATAEQVSAIVPALARHHAAYWDRSDLDWAVTFADPALAGIVEGIYHMCVGVTLDAFFDVISAEMRDVIRAVDGNIGTIWNKLCEGPPTLVHGDFRVDNIGVDAAGAVVAFDWQISGINTGPYDLGFMMSQSVDPDVRAAIEMEQVRAYYRTLCDNGVEHYTFERCLEDYKRTVLVCAIYPVITCGMLDVSTERGKAFGAASLRRSLSAIEALEAHALLPSV
jgi:hypothetical protein